LERAFPSVSRSFSGLQHPFYAFLSAVLATDLSPARSRQLGLRRIITPIVGAVCGPSLRPLLPPAAWAIGVVIMVTVFIASFCQPATAPKVAGYICGIIGASRAIRLQKACVSTPRDASLEGMRDGCQH